MNQDPHFVLGLHPDASLDEALFAYRRLTGAIRDKLQSNDKAAWAKLRHINDAYSNFRKAHHESLENNEIIFDSEISSLSERSKRVKKKIQQKYYASSAHRNRSMEQHRRTGTNDRVISTTAAVYDRKDDYDVTTGVRTPQSSRHTILGTEPSKSFHAWQKFQAFVEDDPENQESVEESSSAVTRAERGLSQKSSDPAPIDEHSHAPIDEPRGLKQQITATDHGQAAHDLGTNDGHSDIPSSNSSTALSWPQESLFSKSTPISDFQSNPSKSIDDRLSFFLDLDGPDDQGLYLQNKADHLSQNLDENSINFGGKFEETEDSHEVDQVDYEHQMIETIGPTEIDHLKLVPDPCPVDSVHHDPIERGSLTRLNSIEEITAPFCPEPTDNRSTQTTKNKNLDGGTQCGPQIENNLLDLEDFPAFLKPSDRNNHSAELTNLGEKLGTNNAKSGLFPASSIFKAFWPRKEVGEEPSTGAERSNLFAKNNANENANRKIRTIFSKQSDDISKPIIANNHFIVDTASQGQVLSFNSDLINDAIAIDKNNIVVDDFYSGPDGGGSSPREHIHIEDEDLYPIQHEGRVEDDESLLHDQELDCSTTSCQSDIALLPDIFDDQNDYKIEEEESLFNDVSETDFERILENDPDNVRMHISLDQDHLPSAAGVSISKEIPQKKPAYVYSMFSQGWIVEDFMIQFFACYEDESVRTIEILDKPSNGSSGSAFSLNWSGQVGELAPI